MVPEIVTTDYHAGGEPFRIVTGGVAAPSGDTVRARREAARHEGDVDAARRLLCHEPRGHAGMYGCFLVPPDDAGAHLGVLFWHNDGYSTACGHGTIALGAWAVETGLVDAEPDGTAEVVIDVPSGRVVAAVHCLQGRVAAVRFRNVPAYVLARDVPARTAYGESGVDLAYGGAIYACVPAAAFGLSVRREDLPALVEVGRAVKRSVGETGAASHPSDPRLSGVYGTILYEDLPDTEDGPHQRNITVFADGQVDRSPCGSGTSARAAVLAADGKLGDGQVLTHDSVIDTRFRARVTAHVHSEGRPAVVTEIEGGAHRTGEHRFVLDAHDPLGTGFRLR